MAKICNDSNKEQPESKSTVEMPWIKPEAQVPNDFELVFIAMFDVKRESFQYYVGWYDSKMQRWYLNDCGYELSVSFWIPIPPLSVNDL